MARNARLLAALTIALVVAAGATKAAAYTPLPGDRAVVQHWHGGAWTAQHARRVRAGDTLNAVTAISARNAWAVGSFTKSGGIDASPLAEHYTGSSWVPLRLPKTTGRRQSDLLGVSASSAKDVWAVGWIDGKRDDGSMLGSFEHFDGKAWKVVPSLPIPDVNLTGVAALSRRNVWAVGFGTDYAAHFVIEHWNGKVWRRVKAPYPQGDHMEELRTPSRPHLRTTSGPSATTATTGTRPTPRRSYSIGTATSGRGSPSRARFPVESRTSARSAPTTCGRSGSTRTRSPPRLTGTAIRGRP